MPNKVNAPAVSQLAGEIAPWKPFECDGKWYYAAHPYRAESMQLFGPFDSKDAADIDSTMAEACMG